MQPKYRNFYDDFGERIAFIREKRGMTLGELSGGSASTAKSWEEGSRPNPEKWEAVASRLKLSVSFVFLGEPRSAADFDFVAKFADEVGPSPYAAIVSEPQPAGDDSAIVSELKKEIETTMSVLKWQAGSEVAPLGWLREELRSLLGRQADGRMREHFEAAFKESERLAKERRGSAPASGESEAAS